MQAMPQSYAESSDMGQSSVLAKDLPRATSIIVIGMAGSGKSTFTGSLQNYSSQKRAKKSSSTSTDTATTSSSDVSSTPPYFVNLDPAVMQMNYSSNIDIRDTIDYQRLMQEYNLGPNGGILTALNLFTTKFDQVLGILEKRSNDVDHIIIDTPGQIEIFTWSASGTIITDSLATTMPTIVAYIIDTPRTLAPATFMSNMLYACSIMYKTKLPFILVFNKIDLQSHQFAMNWMKDFELFQEALKGGSNPTEPVLLNSMGAQTTTRRANGDDGSYMNSLMNSMALVLDEFYNNLRTVGVSSTTGTGLDEFFKAVQEARKEFIDDYRPELEKIVQERAEKKEKDKKAQLDKLMKDMNLTKGGKKRNEKQEEVEEEESDIEPSYDGDGQLLDPDTDEEAANQEDLFSSSGVQFGADGSAWPTPH